METMELAPTRCVPIVEHDMAGHVVICKKAYRIRHLKIKKHVYRHQCITFFKHEIKLVTNPHQPPRATEL